MISKYINLIIITALSGYLAGCSSSSGSSSAGTSVVISVAPSPANAATVTASDKTFAHTSGTITLTKAYLVISSATIETDCSAMSFSAALDGVLDIVVPPAHAHTSATPTSTGVPHVINVMGEDGALNSIGTLSPPTGDYCGVDIDLLAADIDAENRPEDVDMVGKTLHIEGTYSLTAGGGGVVSISTGFSLINRELSLSALMMISDNNRNGSVDIAINYDTWFDMVDLDLLENGSSDQMDDELDQVLLNVSASIHQL
jgi:hypothetical protein